MMRATMIAMVVVGLAMLGCGKGEDAKPEPKPEPKPAPAEAAPPAPAAAPVEPAEPAEPEPTTPEEIELARKSALMEGRDKDAYKYCEMAGIEAGKSDEQALLGCALAACRIKDVDKAREWSKGLSSALMTQAKKICKASGVPL
jgi:hypothetical protein